MATCNNTDGGFDCECNIGWQGNGVTCEKYTFTCGEKEQTCDANANCTFTSNGFNCVCNSGFVGDGVTCVDSTMLSIIFLSFAGSTVVIGGGLYTINRRHKQKVIIEETTNVVIVKPDSTNKYSQNVVNYV